MCKQLEHMYECVDNKIEGVYLEMHVYTTFFIYFFDKYSSRNTSMDVI